MAFTLGEILKDRLEKNKLEVTKPAPEKKVILREIGFQEDFGGNNKYTSSGFGRKIAILDFGQPTPVVGETYDVEVVRDTKPLDPRRGALIVRIIKKDEDTETATTTPVDTAKGETDAEVPLVEKKEVAHIPPPVERDELAGKVYILETEIPFNPVGGESVPKAERFRHFTLDQRTLETLEKIATAVELKEPCLLEGETSTSKTSSIEYLAMMSNNEVARFNLNGQTDTSELVGKFVPNDGQLQIKFEDLLHTTETLSQPSQEIIQRAQAEKRALTLIESQQIAQAEHLKIADWRWQDGIDVQAKKKGQWLILDEINLAEAQILERLNSQLESNPSITLTENGGTVVRRLNEEEMELYHQGKLPGVEPLHPNFRIFGTMNPAEYSGRQPMSPAYKDRWTSYKFVIPPSAKDYSDMLSLMIYGKQPSISIRGTQYESPKIQGMFPVLEKIPGFIGFILKITKFQEAIEKLAKNREIGKGKKEPYIFTRRGLIEFLTYLENKSIIDRKTKSSTSIATDPKKVILRAIQYYYLDKISNPEDLKKVKDQLDMIGISESNWLHKFA